MKRFYREVTLVAADPAWQVALDGRPVRTPGRSPLDLPTAALADAVAAEWAAQGDTLEPATMPLTGFAYAAIDRVTPDVPAFAAGLAAFAETELLCYRADGPASLVARQAAGWDPLLAWARGRYDIDFAVTTGIVHAPQPPATLARIAAAYTALDPFRLAALHPVVTISGSAVIGLAVAEGRLDAAGAWTAGNLDELWQAEQWGRDPLAAAAEAERQASLAAAVRLLGLLAAC